MHTRFFAFFSLLLILAAKPAFSEDWIIAASAFETGNNTTLEIDAGRTIPTLILDKVSSFGSRQVLKNELDMRQLEALRTKRQALFLTLASSIKMRDAIVFSGNGERSIKLAIEKAEKDIDKIKKDINDNLAEADRIAGKTITTKRARAGTVSASPTESTESIAVWKNDVSELITAHLDKNGEPIPKNMLDAYINNEKIRCYLSGSIKYTRADFAIITVSLFLYPSGEKFAEVSEIASLNDLQIISNLLSYAIFEQIVNRMPATIRFQLAENIQTASGGGKLRMTIDGESITPLRDSTVTAGGIHTVYCEVEGYRPESFTYFFESGKEFIVAIDLEEKTESENFTLFSVVTKNLVSQNARGKFYINATTGGESPLLFSVNGHTVMGAFTHESGNTGFFYIPEKTLADVQKQGNAAKYLTVAPIDKDITKKIDTSRKIMYASYSVLMVALPVQAFLNGQHIKYSDAYQLGYSADYAQVEQ
ncbi:MAG: hypothetical protein Ta2A_17330 [Treponemataceae bacterium]|nr:MAG: hypothetical protein Ta2A_17330 [Treponemataceae bacterium]